MIKKRMSVQKWFLITGILLGIIPVFAFAEAKLTSIFLNKSGAQFGLSQPVQAEITPLSQPARIAIDFPETKLVISLAKLSFQNSLFKGVRYGYPREGRLRLVFDLARDTSFSVRTQNDRVILATLTQQNTLNSEALKNLISRSPKKTAKQIIHKPAPHPITVVIDPGHGGQDPGALGDHGTQEKNVVLAIAKQLAELINQQPNMRAVLTRDGDYFVPLINRLRLARKGKADLFVAIHADSYFNSHSSGVSIYALSRHGATTVAAKWLSDRENHSELGGVDLRGLEDQSVELRSVLIDLAQTATITDSLRLGNTLLGSLNKVTRLHYKRVEQAPFLVLKSPDIPSVLVETGFLSNPKEEEKLRDPKYQNKIAKAIFSGIQIYIKKYI